MKKSKVLQKLLKLTWNVRPSVYLSLLLGALITTGNAIFTVMIPKILLDTYNKGVSFQQFMEQVLIICGIKLGLSLLEKCVTIYQEREHEILTHGYLLEFSKKVSRIPYSFLEEARILDLKERAHFTILNYNAFGQLFKITVGFVSGVVTLVTVSAILIAFQPLLFIVIVILASISLYFSGKMAGKLMRITQEVIPINRRYGYYVGKSLELENQKDFRLYQMGDMLTDTIGDLNMKTSEWLHKSNVHQGNIYSIQGIVNYIVQFVTMVYTALRVVSSKYGSQISIGDFTYYIGISNQFSTVLKSTVENIFSLNNTFTMLEPFAEFMDLPENFDSTGSDKVNGFDSIEFKNVVFSYPNSEKIILDDISFTIHKGEKISIVGLNNAGKSTIVKLICRLFEPNSGEILLNGKNIKSYDYEEYLESIGVIFQDFKLFPFSIRENIDTKNRIKDDNIILKILDKVGVKNDILKLPEGMNTKLNKSIHKDGTDMSGGQLQKVAIARCILKDSNMIILDEPTAALDPIVESELYEDFNQLVNNKTSIFISHRMSSSIFCDKILLLQDGKIKAFDSHSNLMKGDNLYRELFEAQSKNYQM